MQALLSKWSANLNVSLVNTDGFLMSNNELEEKGLMNKKGFPESYNTSLLLDFLNNIKSGKKSVKAPIYSHLLYDNVIGEYTEINDPDIVIIEGLNVLQPAPLPKNGNAIPYVSDFFDFSIFVDAQEKDIKKWYIERFLKLKETAFKEDGAYFNKYANLSKKRATETASDLWEKINYKNLVENIKYVVTGPDSLLQVDKDISITLKINPPSEQDLQYDNTNVIFEQNIQMISERIISEIPVKILNPDSTKRIFSSPQTVSLTVIGGIEFISRIEPAEIEVSIDFNSWNNEKQFYELRVKTQSDVLDWMDLSPKSIELLVTQKNN